MLVFKLLEDRRRCGGKEKIFLLLLSSVVVISVQAARCHFCSPALNCSGKGQTIISISTDDHVAVPKPPEATPQDRPNKV